MIISLVTGTYNRLSHLARMVETFRQALPPDWRGGVHYEIVIVDGGSTDGTLAWCSGQPDVRLIEHGELRGAIRAFCDGAKQARGHYVLLANDDIEFWPDSVLPGLAHLERTPTCGGVAFEDNRRALGYGDGYKVQMLALMSEGVKVIAPYAQVGLFPRRLGEACGWWGADDPAFGGHTYGGDNYLSARIYEAGYTIDVVPGCRIRDHEAPDELRRRNLRIEESMPSAYYKRWPLKRPPVFGSVQIADTPVTPHGFPRILYAPIFEPGHPIQRFTKRGLRQALSDIGVVWEVDYLADAGKLLEAAGRWRPDLTVLQVQDANNLPLSILQAMRRANPDGVIVNWNGDVYAERLQDPAMLALLEYVDLQLVVNAAVLPFYAQHGIPSAYWQIGYEPVDPEVLENIRANTPAYDVVFLANAYSEQRRHLGAILRAIPNVKAGLFGGGWPEADGQTLYDFAAGRALYANAKIAISDNQYRDAGFVSNRLFEALAAGVLVLQQHVPALRELTGLAAGEHYIEWHTPDELPGLIGKWLSRRNAPRRREIAEAGKRYVEHRHSFKARVVELAKIVREMRYGAN